MFKLCYNITLKRGKLIKIADMIFKVVGCDK
jgi:hypothetical protein